MFKKYRTDWNVWPARMLMKFIVNSKYTQDKILMRRESGLLVYDFSSAKYPNHYRLVDPVTGRSMRVKRIK